jgi:hypothetical protein
MAQLHRFLKDKLTDIIFRMQADMIGRFTPSLPYDELQCMLLSDDIRKVMQDAGKLLKKEYVNYSYKLGEKVHLSLYTRGNDEMPTILFPAELTNYSEEFMDLIRPLYIVHKSWMDVQFAFTAVCKIIQDVRELNFYAPWVRHIIPTDGDQFLSRTDSILWLDAGKQNRTTYDLLHLQINQLLSNQYTSKRTWMPVELVQMVRQGEELLTQFNLLKASKPPQQRGDVDIQIELSSKDHPTIKWAAEATTHFRMNEANRLKEMDEKRKRKDRWQ